MDSLTKYKNFLQNLYSLRYYFLTENKELSNRDSIKIAIEWLYNSHLNCYKKGFSHSFHLFHGWLPAYPETTGYIIPTLWLASQQYSYPEIQNTIFTASNWLDTIQNKDGSFNDLNGKPQVFDSGQILIGENFLIKQNIQKKTRVAEKVSNWLISQQSVNGSFIRNTYNNIPHTYYSRIGAALVEFGQLSNNPTLIDCGTKNLMWTVSQQRNNGWFDHMSFAHHPPYSHTIIYTLEGLLAGYSLIGDKTLLKSVILCAEALRNKIDLTDGIIRAQYGENFNCINNEVCLTGVSQWAGLCFRLGYYGISGYHKQAVKNLTFAKRLQIQSTNKNLNGGLFGSHPINGSYMRFAIPNWGIKFYIDAIMLSETDIFYQTLL